MKYKGDQEELNGMERYPEEEEERRTEDDDLEDIQRIEVEMAVDKIKLGKAAGPDDIAPELIVGRPNFNR